MRDPNASRHDPRELLAGFLLRAKEIGLLRSADIVLEHWPAPHRPKPLKPGHGAVYVFALTGATANANGHLGRVLKVGKAGPASNARYQSQHYGFSAPSTVARALVSNPIIWPLIGIRSLSQSDVGEWIKTNTERWNFLVSEVDSHLIGQLESYLKAALGPALEGVLASEKSQ